MQTTRTAWTSALAFALCFANETATAKQDSETKKDSETEKDSEPRNELTIVPFVGGDSDVGLGGGYLASFARLHPGYEPFLYRIEGASAITFKGGDSGIETPYIDSYVALDLPHLIRDRLRLRLRLSYTREATLKFYGLGNTSRIPADMDPGDAYFEHQRVHPTARAEGEYQLGWDFHLTWGLSYTHNWITIPTNTRLAEDAQMGSPTERRLLRGTGNHAVVEFSYGLGWDTRDEELNPSAGQYHTLRLDWAPGGSAGLPHRFVRANGAARFYHALVPRRAVLAVRVVTDLLFGEPPFYELPRYDSTSALGGMRGVRGIPAQRYYGKLKLFSNTELRSEIYDFDLFDRNNILALVGFFDAGRLWTDTRDSRDLDGSGLGLHYGIGGGVRVLAGDSFVLRLDAAWSPDANPISAYLASGHIF